MSKQHSVTVDVTPGSILVVPLMRLLERAGGQIIDIGNPGKLHALFETEDEARKCARLLAILKDGLMNPGGTQ